MEGCDNCTNMGAIRTTLGEIQITQAEINITLAGLKTHIEDYEERNDKDHQNYWIRTDDLKTWFTGLDTKVKIYAAAVVTFSGFAVGFIVWFFGLFYSHVTKHGGGEIVKKVTALFLIALLVISVGCVYLTESTKIGWENGNLIVEGGIGLHTPLALDNDTTNTK